MRSSRIQRTLVGLAVLVACATGRTPASSTLAGTHWRLIELNGKPALAAAEQRADLQFARGDSARVSGSSGCNRFMGSFTHTGADLRFGQMASTQMACIDERVTAQERAFLTALGATERYAVAGDTLTLFGPSGALARLVAESPRAMADTTSAAVKANVPLPSDTVGWLGDYVYLADAGRFTDCASGASYPVAQVGESIALERAYTKARTQPGAPVLVSLRGHLEERPAMEGNRRIVHLVVDRFDGASPGHECSEITPVGP